MQGFSPDDYVALLDGLRNAGYQFCDFETLTQHKGTDRARVILRHDVDISLNLAVAMAGIEHDHGIRATYFVLLRSPFYNLFSAANAHALQQLHDWGHRLAAHIDVARYSGDYSMALRERDLIRQVYPFVDGAIVSLHSPARLDPEAIGHFRCLRRVYQPIIEGSAQYITDSTGRWRGEHVLQSKAIQAKTAIHLLTHPIWWMADGTTPLDTLRKCLLNEYALHAQKAHEFLPKLFAAERRS